MDLSVRVNGVPDVDICDEPRCYRGVIISCTTSGTHRVNLVTNEEAPGSAYDKWNTSVIICDTDIPWRLPKS